jgi:DNA primase
VVASGGTSLTQDQLRLIKRYTDNLTIVYDGDAAGIKAALRGLDMALEERLHVHLVLIPDKEDPDSYVHKVGAPAFREFVAANRKDFIFFQLDVALKDAGSDASKKAAVVNQIAETLSRINKAEDFTRQQDYIRRSAEILRIDEAGLNTLVNQHIRTQVAKLESKKPGDNQHYQSASPELNPEPVQTQEEKDAFDLLSKEEANEKQLIKVLLEFGDKIFEEGAVADYILAQFEDPELFENKDLYAVLDEYRTLYQAGAKPNAKTFLYHTNPAVSALVINITEVRHELSDRWNKRDEDLNYDSIRKGYLKYLGQEYIVKEELAEQERYKDDVRSTVTYMQLKKIKKLMKENQKDMERAQSPELVAALAQTQVKLRDLALEMGTHLHLKELEIDMIRRLGTVILK